MKLKNKVSQVAIVSCMSILLSSTSVLAGGPMTAPEVDEETLAAMQDSTTETLDINDPNVVSFNTDYSENVDLPYGSETYTVNIRVKGNWELTPDESTSYRDDENLVQYTRYDASYDEKDLDVILDAGESIDALVSKVTYSHNEADNYLTAKIIVKYQRKSDLTSKLWLYKEVTLKVEQLDSLLLEKVD